MYNAIIDTLKAVRSTDQFYLDDSGKHVIFRQIGGKTRPIRVTSEEYAEWLYDQGVPIDPADQAQLRQIERQLEILERAAEISPELQSRYEDEFNRQRQHYYDYAKRYYQLALENQAKESGVPAHTINEERKRAYDATRGDLVDREELPDRGWESYLKEYTNKIIQDNNIKFDSPEWFLIQAFDVMLMKALDLAKRGASPLEINLDRLIQDEISGDYQTLRRYLGSRYEEYRPSGKEYLFDANILLGIKNLRENMKRRTAGYSTLSNMLSAKYAKMHQDFSRVRDSFVEIPAPPETTNLITRESIPDTLPERFNRDEASSLMGVYRSFKNSPVTGANRVTLHTLARIYESIPEGDRGVVAADLNDSKRGLHTIHKTAFASVYQKRVHLEMDIDVEREVEEILRLGMRAASGGTQDKVEAMREIAYKLGVVDGVNALSMMNEKNPSVRLFLNKWKDCSLNAGRQKGEGPELVMSIVDDEARKKAMYKNKTLQILHRPPPSAPKLDVPEPVRAERVENLDHAGFKLVGKEFVSPEGWKVRPDPSGIWSVLTPDGDKAGEVAVSKVDSREKARKEKNRALEEARVIIDNHAKQPRRVSLFEFKDHVNEEDAKMLLELTDLVKNRGLRVSVVMPGAIFNVSSAEKGINIIRNKSNGRIFMAERGKLPQQATLEDIRRVFGA